MIPTLTLESTVRKYDPFWASGSLRVFGPYLQVGRAWVLGRSGDCQNRRLFQTKARLAFRTPPKKGLLHDYQYFDPIFLVYISIDSIMY